MSDDAPLFVVQQHDARRLHYDVRLEVDGVLKSWAVPRGPSLDPTVKRLAVPTEDHSIEYAEYEGVIADSKYGSGAVIVWDAGVFTNLTEDHGHPVDAAEAIDRGHLKVRLQGVKLHGTWAFTRTGQDWLLVKVRDAFADPRLDLTSAEPRSILSGLTIEEMAATAS
ncbi:DNA ligase D-like protein (predicted 3'-phosphoesterase) [Kribbella amoyensis]|uniref:DNA ligase D-like protein (Predicted 3'-phosphoesterase) n=1 Tax=Kribbella amoyensis TaxID=996641 RepID=A0A561BR18_9ACTN|nr:DNA polymerase ligase N-terminal domain-containing protein [Kribbella amoyensis]TWD81252.1 DNA ligase D-like protein (predicted 3'-phosphoesterase) [Kribbella amoyensis]